MYRHDSMFKIYRNNMTRFLGAKINGARTKKSHDLPWMSTDGGHLLSPTP